MKPKLLLCVALVTSGICVRVHADDSTATKGTSPEKPKVELRQHELSALLAKASPSRLEPNLPHPPVGTSEEFSPYLTPPENTQLHTLLRDPEAASILTRDDVLAALKQRQIDGGLPGFQYNALMIS